MSMHKARKRFGQNFLIDQARLNAVVNKINPTKEDNFIEIGPGTGALTEHILSSQANLTALELDRDLIPILKARFIEYKNFNLLHADALKFDFTPLLDGAGVRVIGNLPYNIATNLIFNFWHIPNILDMNFMLQTEVALRLTADLGDANYGRLSILSQYFCHAQIIMDFPPESFSPPPKVNSSFICMWPKDKSAIDLEQAEILSNTLKICFAQRRKTLANNLKNYLSSDDLVKLDINPKLRPQNLTLDEYLRIGEQLTKVKNKEIN